MAGNGNSSTSTGSAAAGAGVGAAAAAGAGVGSTSTGSQTSSTSGKGSGSGSSGLTFTGLTFSDGKFSAPSGKGTTGNSTSTKGVTLGSVGTGLGLDGSIGEGIGLTTGADGKSTSATKTEPVMTVDEVYGKGNQSIVEDQGDYEAVSNEKSNVETQTFGKQDEISFTPLSITENKGEVENDAIGLFEGLDFQQKDKAAQEVMDAKKARDEAEAEDKSDKAREQLAANESEENEEITFDFKIGDKDEDIANADKNVKDAQAEVDNLMAKVQEHDKIGKYLEDDNGFKEIFFMKHMLNKSFEEVEQAQAELAEAEAKAKTLPFLSKLKVAVNRARYEVQTKKDVKNDVINMSMEKFGEYVTKDLITAKSVESFISREQNNISDLNKSLDEAQSRLSVAKKSYDDLVESKYVNEKGDKTKESISDIVDTPLTEPTPTNKSNAEVSFEATIEAINNADLPEETKSKAVETVNSVEAATKSVNDAANALAANPNDPTTIETYVNAVKTYNENLENALKGNPLAKTDLNKIFTKTIVKANDFDVKMPDGTIVSYAEFATKKAVESPTLAKGLYEAKAKALADKGHTVLAAIENAKAKMVTTWLGSKFTFADNQVRSQFNQMAKTDMRATYATYNNVLNDKAGKYSEADKAEAFDAIQQAKSLMTASAALQASTGFLSGIGDSMKDGVYGVTNPGDLNVSQKTMNNISNFAKVVLGLGVTPGANKAYQNMYYLAGDKAKNSMLFGRDFDGDGFALCQEYGNNAAAGMISGVGELATGIALFFNPATAGMGLNLAIDSVQTFLDGLYGVQSEAKKSVKYSSEIVSYLNEAKDIVAEAGTDKEETVSTTGVTIDQVIDSAISQIENFELKSNESNNIDNWLEGSGSSTTDNEKFNQSLTYDEWLKLIEADPTMQKYAKKLIAEKA